MPSPRPNYVTPNEARSLWCPRTAAFTLWQGNRFEILTNRGHRVEVPLQDMRVQVGTINGPLNVACCISRHCMSWRWRKSDETGDDDRGFCVEFGGRFPDASAVLSGHEDTVEAIDRLCAKLEDIETAIGNIDD